MALEIPLPLLTGFVMLALGHLATGGQATRRVRVLCALACVVVFLFYVTGANHALSALFSTFYASPKGAFTTPKGIIGLCRAIQATAAGQLTQVTALLLLLYVTLQTFCVPGTIALNAVCGAVLGLPVGLPLCIVAGTVGACSCYTMSSLVGATVAEAADRWFLQGKGIPKLRGQVARFRSELFVYLLFLRLTPVIPNWLINLASPVANVPLQTFALATLVGIAPQTYLSVRFGTLVNADGLASIVSFGDTAAIALLGVLAVFVSRLKKRFAAATPAAGGPETQKGDGLAPEAPTVPAADHHTRRQTVNRGFIEI